MAGEGPKTPRSARELVNKVRIAISRGIDGMRDKDKKQVMGVARLSELIRDALEVDPIGTLKALSSYAPKDVSVESFTGKQADQLTDAELANIIATRALQRADEDTPAGEESELDSMLR